MCLVRADVCTEVSRCLLSCHRNIANLIIHSLIVTRVSYLVSPIFLGSVSPGICSLDGNDSHILSPHSCGHVVRLYSNLCHRCVIVLTTWGCTTRKKNPFLERKKIATIKTRAFATFKTRAPRGGALRLGIQWKKNPFFFGKKAGREKNKKLKKNFLIFFLVGNLLCHWVRRKETEYS